MGRRPIRMLCEGRGEGRGEKRAEEGGYGGGRVKRREEGNVEGGRKNVKRRDERKNLLGGEEGREMWKTKAERNR